MKGAIAARGSAADPRIEREASRRRAMLLELQLLLQVGEKADAEARSRRILASMWMNADSDFTARAELLRLDACVDRQVHFGAADLPGRFHPNRKGDW